MEWSTLLAQFPPGQEPPLLQQLVGERGTLTGLSESPEQFLARLGRLAPAERRGLLTEHVTGQVSAVLGLELARAPAPDTALMDLGMDSLMALELRNRLSAYLPPSGGALPATFVFNYPTIGAIAGYLADALGAAAPVTPESSPLESQAVAQAVSQAVASVEQLSEDEAEALLLLELEKHERTQR
jgi:CheY-like chemotaxis protein